MKTGVRRLILQPRDRLLLEKLGILRLLDRKQIEQLAGFHSAVRANVRLLRLRKAGLIVRYCAATSTGSRRSVFALSKQGAAEVHIAYAGIRWPPDTVLLGNSFAAHQLALNDIYIAALNSPGARWFTFAAAPFPAVPIIPDAAIITPNQTFLVEMDMGTEPLSVWSRKAALYMKLALSGGFRDIFPHPQFAVLVVTDSEPRLQSLRRHIAKQTQKLFWFATLSAIKEQGFWSVSWLRPHGDTLSLPGA